jgi:hypothetical protein
MSTIDVILAVTRRLTESERRRLVAALERDDGAPGKGDTQRGYAVRRWPEAAPAPARVGEADAAEGHPRGRRAGIAATNP